MEPIEVTDAIVKKEVEYRQKKRWDVFSWSSTILVAIIGGAIALQTKTVGGLEDGQRMAITLAVLVLAWFAYGWLSYHREREELVVTKYFNEETSKLLLGKTGEKRPFFGDKLAVVFLAIAALLATWLSWIYAMFK